MTAGQWVKERYGKVGRVFRLGRDGFCDRPRRQRVRIIKKHLTWKGGWSPIERKGTIVVPIEPPLSTHPLTILTFE